jgi:UDP-N-acetylmuramoyl-L-alanyl-D-glutamate--2,6-diaminopimelate ligase
VELRPDGSRFVAETPAGSIPIELCLPGRYNVANALAAIAIAVSQELPLDAVQRALAGFRGIVGRMEPIDEGQDFQVVVDFAHTPNALEKALTVARTLTRGRVISVFGCAGLRDRQKRAAMGEIAGRLADLVMLTAEDPRTEDVNAIIAEMAAGCRRAGRKEGADYWAVPDREEAIGFAVRLARPGDLVIVTGKGHERSMCYGTVETPWSDHDACRRQLSALALRRLQRGHG